MVFFLNFKSAFDEGKSIIEILSILTFPSIDSFEVFKSTSALDVIL